MGFRAVEILAALVAVGELVRSLILLWRFRLAIATLPEVDSSAALGLPQMRVWRTAAPQALSLAVASAAPVIDRTFATGLGPGSVTVLDLAEKIFYVPQTVVMSSIVLVSSARWSAMGTKDVNALRHDLQRTLVRGISISALLGLASLVAIVLVGFAFPSTVAGAPTHLLRNTTILLLLGMPAAGALALGSRFLTAIKKTYVFPLLAAVGFFTNVIGDWLGVHTLGLAGIAGASTVVRTVNGLIYLILCRQFRR